MGKICGIIFKEKNEQANSEKENSILKEFNEKNFIKFKKFLDEQIFKNTTNMKDTKINEKFCSIDEKINENSESEKKENFSPINKINSFSKSRNINFSKITEIEKNSKKMEKKKKIKKK